MVALVTRAARRSGLHVWQSDVHTMAQRGGDLTAKVRIADAPVHGELIPFGTADLLISMEPLEALPNLPTPRNRSFPRDPTGLRAPPAETSRIRRFSA